MRGTNSGDKVTSGQGDKGSNIEGTRGQEERRRRYIKILDTGGVIILLLQK